ncbi:MAG: hypothetical protein JWN48_5573 [Myxococcaceae bacterium]|nr:hypothetical protein [Myxococcaceae bacterium]
MIFWRWALAAALALAASGCSKKNNSGVAFPFERAEHMTFSCFAPLAPPRNKEFVTLPQHCCQVLDPSSNDGGVPRDPKGAAVLPPECKYAATVLGSEGDAGVIAQNALVGTPPLLHALVTQSTRGEVAAVDLLNDRVLDSDRLVPGYTFLDTGGLPSAIVAPKVQPRIIQPVGRPTVTEGPAWVYVASAEESQVRAIASCRFRSGGTCGPDRLPENLDANYVQRTRFALPSPPRDMILGPGPTGPDQALWVTLPDRSLIVRLELAETPTQPVATPIEGAPLDVVRSVDPFAVDGSGDARTPKVLVPFQVPAPVGVVPLEPIREGSEYTAMCGLGHDFAPANRKLPLAPRGKLTGQAQPNLMHFDAESGFLLVTDRVEPVLHAFTFSSDGALQLVGALPTGTAVRDFVITPRVPDNVPVDIGLLKEPRKETTDPEDRTRETKRYLYAIDDRGLLMVFDFQHDPSTGGLVLQPLLAPTPGVDFADRIDVPTPITALDVIDTRGQSDWQCGEQTRKQLVDEIDRVRAIRPRTQIEENEIAGLDARIQIYDNAGSSYLRGVFLAAASANGTLSIIDIHDLDVSCRARKECCAGLDCASELDLRVARNHDAQDAVAVRRHAVRRSFVGQLESVVTNSSLVDVQVVSDPSLQLCGPAATDPNASSEPFVLLGDTKRVCSPRDPWTAVAESWSVIYQGAIPNGQTLGAAFQTIDGQDSSDPAALVKVLAPSDMNLCNLGVQPGDLVAVLGNPPKELESSCGKPVSESASVYQITQAFADHLVVQLPQDASLAPQSMRRTVQEITRCYPDSVGIELRAGRFLVTGTGGTYLHPIIKADDGSCVADPNKDPLLTSRPVPVGPEGGPPDWNGALSFKNPYVQFTLSKRALTTDQTLRNTAVQVRNGSASLSVTSVPTGSTSVDALPAALRYEPETGALFLLDTASQGLRRYTLQPFAFDKNSFR